MIWRAWCFAMGLPLGALFAVGWIAEPTFTLVLACSLLSGAGLLVAVSLLVRLRADTAHFSTRLAAASSAGLVALPAGVAQVLGFAPGAAWLLALCGSTLALALGWGLRSGPRLSLRQVTWAALLSPVAGSLLVGGLSGAAAALAPRAAPMSEHGVALIFHQDARVATRAMPCCRQVVSEARVLLERGAHPRINSDGTELWFDAPVEGGLRQVHRLDLVGGEVVCWSCGQPGNNQRPAPAPGGAMIVFDSDRHASRFDPTDTELYRMNAHGDEPPAHARRLTYAAGADEQAIFSALPGSVLWSRREAGRYFVASAAFRSSHGGTQLRDPSVVYAGGTSWVAPLAWSPNARTLLVARGNPLAPLAVLAIDPATGAEKELLSDAPGRASIGFNADGGWVALARTGRGRAAGWLPQSAGFLVAPLYALEAPGRPSFRGTAIVTGSTHDALRPVELGEHGAWGEPTGVALYPNGDALVVGQRRSRESGAEERLLELRLTCLAETPESS